MQGDWEQAFISQTERAQHANTDEGALGKEELAIIIIYSVN